MQILTYLRLFYDIAKLKFEIFLANANHRKNNQQYFVIPTSNGKLAVLSARQIKHFSTHPYKKTRKFVNGQYKVTKYYLLPKGIEHTVVMRDCFYYTPYKIGDKTTKISKQVKKKKSLEWLTFTKKHRTNRAV